MKKSIIFCLTLSPSHEKKIRMLNYIPVGLGEKSFSKNCFTDKLKKNISNKNPFYGEYTFHYWLWKNYLSNLDYDWVGFCQYRKFFLKEKLNEKLATFEAIKKLSLNEIGSDFDNYDCILGEKFSVTNYKFIKIFKNYLSDFLKKPQRFFSNKERTIKLHFDLYHGKGNLDLAIDLLDEENKNDFRDYVNSEKAFYPHNMFICKKNFLKKYYESVFPWLEKCEQIFGFSNLKGYGMKRIYGFLAERYLSYWFSKNCTVKELPIIVKDLSDYKNL